MEDWANRLPAGWRREWFSPVRHQGRTHRGDAGGPGPGTPAAGRLAAQACEADAARCAFDHIIGRSAAMSAMIRRARQFAARRVPVLIEGETGVGKELLARAVHGETTGGGPSSPSTAAR